MIGGGLALFDAAGDLVGVIQGGRDALTNGPTVGNTVQILASGAGFAGNLGGRAAAAKGRSEIAPAPRSVVLHATTSGAKLVPNPNKTTTVIGAYGPDLKHIMGELGVPAQTGHLDHILHGLKPGNKGGFNFLNVAEDVYKAGVHRGGFFTKVNAAWIDDAVARGDDIVVVSSRKFLRDEFGELTGFGKEVDRLINAHGYRWNGDFTRLLPKLK